MPIVHKFHFHIILVKNSSWNNVDDFFRVIFHFVEQTSKKGGDPKETEDKALSAIVDL